jgi:hypothetical protein
MRPLLPTPLADASQITPTMLCELILLFGCWLIFLATYLFADGMVKLALTPNHFPALLATDLLMIASMNRLRKYQVGQDMLDIAIATFLFDLTLFASYEAVAPWYPDLMPWLPPVARFGTYWVALRCLFAPTSEGAEGRLHWIWPPIGPVGLTSPGRWRATWVHGKTGPLLVWLGVVALAVFSASDIFGKNEPDWRRVMLGLLTVLLFWRYFGAILLGTTTIVAESRATRAELDELRSKLPAHIGVRELDFLATFNRLDHETQRIMLGAFRDLHADADGDPPPNGPVGGRLRVVK